MVALRGLMSIRAYIYRAQLSHQRFKSFALRVTIVGNLKIYITIHYLIWVIFRQNCASTDVIAPTEQKAMKNIFYIYKKNKNKKINE